MMFSKNDLINGDILVLKNGEVIMGNELNFILDEFDDSLECVYNQKYSIIKVFRSNKLSQYSLHKEVYEKGKLVFEREEYTEEQKKIFKALKMLGFNYIAKDKDWCVYAYDKKQIRGNIEWHSDVGYSIVRIDSIKKFANIYKLFSFENVEPFKIPD